MKYIKRISTLIIGCLFYIITVAQTVPDYQRTIMRGNQAVIDDNLKAAKAFNIPCASSFTLNGAKDVAGYIMYNTTTNKFGIYKGGGVWYTFDQQDLSNYLTNQSSLNPANVTQTTNYRFTTDVQQSAWSSKQNAIGYTPENQSNKSIANGYASLDNNAKVPLNQINDALLGAVNYQGAYNPQSNSPVLPAVASSNKGYYWIATQKAYSTTITPADTIRAGDWIISNGIQYNKVDNNNAVTQVQGKTGNVILKGSDILIPNYNPISGTIVGTDNLTQAIGKNAANLSQEISIARANELANTNLANSKALPNGSNATGTWPINISGNALQWNGQLFSGTSVSNPDYIMGHDNTLGSYGPMQKTVIKAYLNISDGSLLNNSISGNANTVTNGVYTANNYADPNWITSLAYSKLTGVPVYQSPITLSTNGNSGLPTFSNNTLNIPNYTLAGLGGQPILSGNGFVKLIGSTISYDNNSYYLSSNPNNFITPTSASVLSNKSFLNSGNNYLVVGTTDGTGGAGSTYAPNNTPQVTVGVPSGSTDIAAYSGGYLAGSLIYRFTQTGNFYLPGNAYITGRTSGADAVNNNEYITKQQLAAAVSSNSGATGTPSVTYSTTGLTVSVAGNNVVGIITVTTPASWSNSGAIVTLTFGSSFSYPNNVVPVVTEQYSSGVPFAPYAAIGGTNSWNLYCFGSNNLQSSTTYKFNYHCGGY